MFGRRHSLNAACMNSAFLSSALLSTRIFYGVSAIAGFRNRKCIMHIMWHPLQCLRVYRLAYAMHTWKEIHTKKKFTATRPIYCVECPGICRGDYVDSITIICVILHINANVKVPTQECGRCCHQRWLEENLTEKHKPNSSEGKKR